MRIACVADTPQHLPAIAQAHLQAFGTLLPDWNVDEALSELRSHTRDEVIPTTWVALDQAQWLGSVSLLDNGDTRIRQWSPWLASLYVQPQARGQGIGEALVAHCVQIACRSPRNCAWMLCICIASRRWRPSIGGWVGTRTPRCCLGRCGSW